MKIELTKTVSYTVPHGFITVEKVPSHDRFGDPSEAWQVTYHNDLLKNSPFKLHPTFSSKFSLMEVANSHEIRKAIRDITGNTPDEI